MSNLCLACTFLPMDEGPAGWLPRLHVLLEERGLELLHVSADAPYYCKDTRKRGVVTSRNRTVVIDCISVHKDDLIFGDGEGIVVIPKKHEPAILREAMSRRKNEPGILPAIAQGIKTENLVSQFGRF